jgi:hypothetical protein
MKLVLQHVTKTGTAIRKYQDINRGGIYATCVVLVNIKGACLYVRSIYVQNQYTDYYEIKYRKCTLNILGQI